MSRPKLKKNFEFYGNDTISNMSISDPILQEVECKCSPKTVRLVDTLEILLFPRLTFSTSSKATLDNEDTYNEYMGRDLSGMKCDLKYHKWMLKRYQAMMDMLIKAERELLELAYLHSKKIDNIEDDINSRYLK